MYFQDNYSLLLSARNGAVGCERMALIISTLLPSISLHGAVVACGSLAPCKHSDLRLSWLISDDDVAHFNNDDVHDCTALRVHNPVTYCIPSYLPWDSVVKLCAPSCARHVCKATPRLKGKCTRLALKGADRAAAAATPPVSCSNEMRASGVM